MKPSTLAILLAAGAAAMMLLLVTAGGVAWMLFSFGASPSPPPMATTGLSTTTASSPRVSVVGFGPSSDSDDVAAESGWSLANLPPALAGRADEIRKMALPCVRLQSIRKSEVVLGPMASKFGGVPHLAHLEDWPRTPSGDPMTFIGQVNFAEISRRAAGAGEVTLPPDMPTKGILSLFINIGRFYRGEGDPADAGHWQVRWAADPAPVEPLKVMPVQVDPRRECALDPVFGWSLPTHGMDQVFPFQTDTDEEYNAYDALQEALRGGLNGHDQLFGHAQSLQDDPRSDAWRAVTRPADAATAAAPAAKVGEAGMPAARAAARPVEAEEPPASAAAKPAKDAAGGVAEWQLLWQVTGSEESHCDWADSGRFFLMIRTEDLRAGRLDRAQLVFQAD